MASTARVWQLCVAVVCAAGMAEAAITPNVWFNITLDSTSPALGTYWASDKAMGAVQWNANALSFWNTTFDEGDSFSRIGAGRSRHVGVATLNPNHLSTSVSLAVSVDEFLAKAVYVYGAVGGDADPGVEFGFIFDREFDSSNIKTIGPGPIAVHNTSLAYGWHDMSISLSYGLVPSSKGPIRLTVDQVVATVGMQTEANSFETVAKRIEPFVLNGKPNPFFSYGGHWSPLPELPELLFGTPTDSSGEVDMDSRGEAVVSFHLPSNTAFVVLDGGIHPNVSEVKITISPAPPLSRTVSGIQSLDLTGNDLWTAANVTYYYSALDPTVQYRMTIRSSRLPSSVYNGPNLAERGFMALQSVTFYSGLKDEPPSGGGAYTGSLTSTTSGPTDSAPDPKGTGAGGGSVAPVPSGTGGRGGSVKRLSSCGTTLTCQLAFVAALVAALL